MKSFEELWAELSQKAVERPEGSGTVAALDAGIHAIGKKILEEAGEVWLELNMKAMKLSLKSSVNFFTICKH